MNSLHFLCCFCVCLINMGFDSLLERSLLKILFILAVSRLDLSANRLGVLGFQLLVINYCKRSSSMIVPCLINGMEGLNKIYPKLLRRSR